MAKSYANIQPAFDTWAGLITKINYVLSDISTVVLTTDTTTNGAITTGNAYVNGFFGANTLTVLTALRGGTGSTSAPLTIDSNLSMSASYSWYIGNSTVNTSANSTVLRIGTGTINSTAFTGSANNSTYLNGQAASYYTNATNISTGTLATAQLPATANISTALNVGANVNLSTSTISIGNSTVNTVVNATSFSGTANNANNLGGVTLTTLQTQITGNAATAYTNSVTQATTLAGTAYSNAIAVAANATNISSGTLATARLPATANISTAVNIGANVNLTTSGISIGNSTVNTTVNATSFSGIALTANAATYVGNSSGTIGNIVAWITGNSATAYTNAAAQATTLSAASYTNATAFAANATNISTGTLDTARLPATANISTAINVGANVNLSVTGISIGNSSVNTTVNATSFSGTANNANNLSGVTLSTIQTQITGNAATAYTNAVASATTLAGTAYTNAIAVAANATNLTSGTLATARLPATANISTAVNIGANVNLTTAGISIGNATVNTTVNATSFSGTAANASLLGSISLATIQSQITGNAATAYTNAAAQATTLSAAAYTNAIAIAANATNITSGTIDTARLPSTINTTAVNVGGNLTINVSSIRIGNATVYAVLTSSGLQGAGFTSSNVSSFNTRTGDITLLSSDIVTALTYTPLSANAAGTISGTLTIGSSGDLITRDVIASREVRSGNSTVNTVINSTAFAIGAGVINSTAFTGSANNTTYLNGQLASYYTNATNISTGTLATAQLPATANISTAINIGNVNINTSTVNVGNSTVNVSINATSFSGTAANASLLGSVSLATIQSQITGNAATAYTNAATLAATAYTNAAAQATTLSAAAYTNALGQATTLSSAAYTNATTFAANATNISSGTLATARLPATANISTAINVGANVNLTTSGLSIGNSSVNVSINATSFSGLSVTATTATYLSNTSGTLANVSSWVTGNAAAAYTNAVAQATTLADTAYSNAIAISANATNISSGTLATARLPATANIATALNIGANVNLSVTGISIGNATVNTTINSTSFSGLALTANAATYVGNSSGTISNIASWISGNAAAAYTNAAAQATTLSAAAYANATTFAANATNINSGTLDTARLPATVNVATTINVGANVSLNVSSIKVGNATVYAIIDSTGLTTSVGASGVTAFNTRTGNVTLTSADVTTALAYTPVSANSGGSIDGSLTLTSSGDFTSRDILSSREVRVGNSTVNSVVNSTSTSVTDLVSIGNSTINTSINSTAISFSGSAINASSITGKAIAMAMIFGG
jgi:hypothetical protein